MSKSPNTYKDKNANYECKRFLIKKTIAGNLSLIRDREEFYRKKFLFYAYSQMNIFM